MLIVPPIAFHRRRAPARAFNAILQVARGGPVNRLTLTISGTLIDLPFSQAMQALVGGTWRSSTGGNFDNLPEVVVLFGAFNVTTATQWRIIDPTVWVFDDGRPLSPPFEGNVS